MPRSILSLQLLFKLVFQAKHDRLELISAKHDNEHLWIVDNFHLVVQNWVILFNYLLVRRMLLNFQAIEKLKYEFFILHRRGLRLGNPSLLWLTLKHNSSPSLEILYYKQSQVENMRRWSHYHFAYLEIHQASQCLFQTVLSLGQFLL